MTMITGRYGFWTDRKKETVRKLLAQGVDRALIAERMGVTLRTLRAAIHKFDLRSPEAIHG
jgi:hypothetical protein